jgi:hypothetical protein
MYAIAAGPGFPRAPPSEKTSKCSFILVFSFLLLCCVLGIFVVFVLLLLSYSHISLRICQEISVTA